MAALSTLKDWIRWKYLGFVLIFLAAIIVFCMIFLDPLVKRAIETLGTKVAGAKVEVKSVDVSMHKTFVKISGMQVADRNDPWKNLFEFQDADFNYAFEPLLSKKLVVQEMKVEGLRWGTMRKTSGEVRQKEEPSVMKKIAEKIGLPEFDKDAIRKMDWKSLTDADKLASVKAIEDSKKKAEAIKDDWSKKIEDLNVNDAVKQIQASAAEAQSFKFTGPQDLPKAKKILEDLQTSRELLKTKVAAVQDMQQALNNELGQARSGLAATGAIQKKDVQDIMGKLKLPDFSPAGLARSVFGPVWLDRLDKARYWVERARKSMPAKQDLEKVKEEPKPRREGLTITFPGMKSWPKFLVERILVSGSSAKKENDPSGIDFKGQILGVTSEPAIYGKPMTADLSGARGNLALSLKGLLDHRGEVSKDEFTLSARGIDLAGKSWSLPQFLPSVTEAGTGSADFTFGMTGPALKASLKASAQGLKISGGKEPEGDLQRILHKAIAGATALDVSAAAEGTGENLDFTISTNLDNLMANQAKSLIGEEADKVRTQIESRVQEIVGSRRAEAQGKLDDAQKSTLGKLSQKSSPLMDQQNVIQGLIEKIEKQTIGGGLKGLFK